MHQLVSGPEMRAAPSGAARRPLLATLVAFLLSVGATGTASAGDADAGAKVFKKCKSCHAVGADAKDRVGPHLNDLFGRVAAAHDGFKYSKSMRKAGEEGLHWTAETLDAFLADPRGYVPKTRMSFRGLKDEADRANLLAYLRTFSGDVPEEAPADTHDAAAAGAMPVLDPAVLALEGDPEYGEYLSSECLSCHQASGAAAGIPSITGWPHAEFVVAMHAYKQKLRPHPVMQMMAGRLNDEEIAALAAYFNGLH